MLIKLQFLDCEALVRKEWGRRNPTVGISLQSLLVRFSLRVKQELEVNKGSDLGQRIERL